MEKAGTGRSQQLANGYKRGDIGTRPNGAGKRYALNRDCRVAHLAFLG
jgi:hypothetical protein